MIISASKSFGGAVALVREKRGLSQADLANKLNTSEDEIGLLEKGVLFFGAGYPEEVAKALEIPLNVLALIGADKSELTGAERMIAEKLTELALQLLERDEGA